MAFPYLVIVPAALLAWQLWTIKLFYQRQVGFDLAHVESGELVQDVSPRSPAAKAGLLPGDIIAAIDGHPIRTDRDYTDARARFRSGEATTWLVARSHSWVRLVVVPGIEIPWVEFGRDLLLFVAYLGIAWLALVLSPAFAPASLLSVLSLVEACEMALPSGLGSGDSYALSCISYALAGMELALSLHLAACTPRPIPLLSRHSWLLRAAYLLGAVVSAVLIGVLVAAGSWLLSDQIFNHVIQPLWAAVLVMIYGYTAATFPAPSGRAIARLCLMGVLSWLLLILLLWSRQPASMPSGLRQVQALIWLFYPIAVLTALLREQRRKRALRDALAWTTPRGEPPPLLAKRIVDELSECHGQASALLFALTGSGPDLQLVAANPEPRDGPRPLLPAGATLLQLLERTEDGLDLAAGSPPELPAKEAALLAMLEAEIVIAGLGDDHEVVAVVALGPKASRSPYTAGDRRLLRALMRSFAGAVEHWRLRQDLEQARQQSSSLAAHLARQGMNLLRECPQCGRCTDDSVTSCPHDGSELLAGPVERTIAERYHLQQLLGRGGMGAVYEATDLRLERRVAVKVLTGTSFADPVAVKRFEREARMASRIHHLNVVAVFDCGRLQAGGAFMVMEALDGQSLAGILARRCPLSPGLLADWAEQILAALQAAHALRILHRDLKPANIFVARQATGPPVLKLLDFGVAKVLAEGDLLSMDLTAPGTQLGTLPYMAPEQLTGAPCDERTDLFAFGVLLVEALTGERPFCGASPGSVIRAILCEPYRLPGDGGPRRQMDAALQRLLAKDSRERLASAAEARRTVIPALRGLASSTGEPRGAEPPPPPPAPLAATAKFPHRS